MEVSWGDIRGIREDLSTVKGSLLLLETVVLLSSLSLAVLVLYRSANRRCTDKPLRGAVTSTYVVFSQRGFSVLWRTYP